MRNRGGFTVTTHELTQPQRFALRELGKAFALCSAQGLVFYGMDRSLLAFDAEQLEAADRKEAERTRESRPDPHAGMRACNQGAPVNTHGTYKDSGGW